jgi:glycine cleavage system aminomethyltransferase T
VTSALYSPRLEKNIGYAWLPVELSEIGTSVIVGTPAGKAGATVVAKPFVDPKKEIPKS